MKEWHKVENLQPIPPPTPDGFLKVSAHARASFKAGSRGRARVVARRALTRPACSCVHVLPQRLTHGDEVEVLHDDGWWRMTFMGTRPHAEGGGLEYNVHSALYQVERWLPAEHVRPAWKRWGSTWRQLDQMRKPAPPVKAASLSPSKPSKASATSPKKAGSQYITGSASSPASDGEPGGDPGDPD